MPENILLNLSDFEATTLRTRHGREEHERKSEDAKEEEEMECEEEEGENMRKRKAE
jgi:hypothetical protein